MNKIKETLTKVKTHIEENKFAYAASAVAVAAIAIQQKNRKDFDEFLTSKGIDLEEYYLPEAYEEKMNAQ